MWVFFWLLLLVFIVLLISELGFFPYYSYFENDTFWIRHHGFLKKTLDLNQVVRATLVQVHSAEDIIQTIQLWTTEKEYSIRTVGIFCYASNVALLKRIQREYPQIDFNHPQLQKYLLAETSSGFSVIDEHFMSYILLGGVFALLCYFLYASIAG